MFDVTAAVYRHETIEQVFEDVVTLIPPGWQYPEITRCRIRVEGREYVSQPFEATAWRHSADIVGGGETCGTVEVFYLEECPEMDEGPFLREEFDLLEGIANALSGAIERRQTELEKERISEQFLQAQKMEAIGLLAGGVAHDFNNLLTVILSSCSFMVEELREEDPLLEDVRQIESAGDRAVSLTRQLLAFSRRQVLQTEILDLHGILKDLDKMLRRLIGEDIDLNTKIDAELWKVVADPGQIEQIVMNLVVNARDAMPAGGKVTIEATNVELDEAYARSHDSVTPGPHVMLGVSDTGSGMDAATLARIFDPFFTTKEKGRGTGLGLSTVHGIVKQHGGHIWAYSEPGEGTSFKIYLPKALGTEQEVTEVSDEVVDFRGRETVLVVEDEPAVLRLAVRVLERKGYTVLKARDGLEGETVANAHQGQIDLLLTDVVMPKASGKQLAEKLLVSRPDLKVLYMSGYTDNSIVHHGILDANTHFLEKPFSLNALAKKVREVLNLD